MALILMQKALQYFLLFKKRMKRGAESRETSGLSGDTRTFIAMKSHEYLWTNSFGNWTGNKGADSMALPRRYDMSKASQFAMVASYGKANLCNHYSNNLSTFQDMLIEMALTVMTFLTLWVFHGKEEGKKKHEQ